MSNILACSGYEITKNDVVQASGCYYYDSNGKRFVDFEAGVWCTVLGHNDWRINETIRAQLDNISHCGFRYTTPVVDEAAAGILDTLSLPNGKCVFLCSGSEAVEFAIQLARKTTGKPLLLALSGFYLAAYGSADSKRSDEWYVLDWKVCTACQHPARCDEQCPLLQNIPFDKIGGFVFEPGNASGLVRFPPQKLVSGLTALIKKRHGLLIVDEVTTGLGRTGTWYGFQHYDIQPDIVALGKALGNGYPVSAVAVVDQVAESASQCAFHHAQSHQDDPLGCAIAHKVLQLIKQDYLVERSSRLGLDFTARLNRLKERHAAIKEVRGQGLMIVAELDTPYLFGIYQQLLLRGLVVGCKPSAGILRFYPPLTIAEADIAQLTASLDDIIAKLA